MALELKTPMQKLALMTVVVIAGTVILGINMIVKPNAKVLQKLQGERRIDTEKSDAVRRIAEAEKKTETYRPFLAEKKESTWFIETLNDLADLSGINLSLVTPMARQPAGDYVKIPMRIELNCPWNRLGDFLSRIESHSPLIRVESMRVEGSSDANKPVTDLRVSMTLAVLRPADGS